MQHMQKQNTYNCNTTNISPFLDYIDSIIKELIEASETIHPEQSNLIECVASTESLQEFMNHCYAAKPEIKIDVLHGVIKVNRELYVDLLRPALLRRLQQM